MGQRPLEGKRAMEVGPREPSPAPHSDGESRDGAWTLQPVTAATITALSHKPSHLVLAGWGG